MDSLYAKVGRFVSDCDCGVWFVVRYQRQLIGVTCNWIDFDLIAMILIGFVLNWMTWLGLFSVLVLVDRLIDLEKGEWLRDYLIDAIASTITGGH